MLDGVVDVIGDPKSGAGVLADFKVNVVGSLAFSSGLLAGGVTAAGVVDRPKPKVNLGASAGASVLGT